MNGGPSAGYPGNLTLPIEVREKILSTFRHTLDLYRDGKLDDCLIGCDFILKMDPRFAPARKLQEKARNPKAEVDLAELQSAAASTAARSEPATEMPAARDTGPVPLPATEASRGPAQRETAPVRPPGPAVLPGDADALEPVGGMEPAGVEGLEDLSLDSLSLDGPLPDLAPSESSEPGLAFEPGSSQSEFAGLSQGPLASDPGLVSPETVSPAQEIAALLKKGDEARDSGDGQQAIEIWSRIFLIDINNAEAVTRIEDARRKMAEESRRVAASLEKGQESFARGDLEAAKAQFDTVLTLGEEPSPPAPTPPVAGVAATPVVSPLPSHDLSAVAAPGDVLAEELEQSGPPGGRRSWSSIPRPPRETTPEVEEAGKRAGLRLPRVSPRIAIIAGSSLVAVAVVVFFLLRSPASAPDAGRAPAGPTLEHATQLFQEGKIEETLAELRQIPRGHPDYGRAQKLLASLGDDKAPAAGPAPPGADTGPAASREASAADPAALRANAERALDEKRYIDAMKSFSLAAPHFQGDPTFSQKMAAASEKVSELTPAVKLYNDGEYETAIPMLWRIYQASRENQDARSYLLRSYYNQGILQLQNGLYDKAKDSFGEVLALDPQDGEAARHHLFAQRYRGGDLDLLGRIYVRYISPRP